MNNYDFDRDGQNKYSSMDKINSGGESSNLEKENNKDLFNNYLMRLSPLGFSALTAVQRAVIPHIEAGESILFQSETGTGKTFAYLLPLLNRVTGENAFPRILIVSPTLELAAQIKTVSCYVTDMKIAILFGSSSMKRQLEALKEKPCIVIGSAERLCELIEMKKLKTAGLFAVVFDEADRLVKKETIDGTRAILNILPKGLEIIGCSATITEKAKEFFGSIAGRGIAHSQMRFIEMPGADVISRNIEHWAVFAKRRNKADALRSLIYALKSNENTERIARNNAPLMQGKGGKGRGIKILVFYERGYDVERIASFLKSKGVNCEGLYAKSGRQERKASLDRFRSGKTSVLITSDLSSRGLDIADITHVIQMDLSDDTDTFIHRAGRTARAGKCGVNIVIGDEIDIKKLNAAAKKLRINLHQKILRDGKILDAKKVLGSTD